ncbi:MAG: hypothetical protein ACHP9Z_26495, partial [Streptosporangiales bacterium]
EQIADAVAALRRPADAGPRDREKPKMCRRGRRVAARTKAAAPPGKQHQPEAGEPASAGGVPAGTEQAAEDAPLAKVIPMGIFDPFAEADKRW